MLVDDRLSDIAMWREELLAEINADTVEMDNMKVPARPAAATYSLWPTLVFYIHCGP